MLTVVPGAHGGGSLVKEVCFLLCPSEVMKRRLQVSSLCGASFAILVGLMTWRCVPVMTEGSWVGAVCLEEDKSVLL